MNLKKKITCFFTVLLYGLGMYGAINPQATYIKEGAEVTEWQNIKGDAPLHVRFTSNATNLADGATVEWHIRHRTSGTNITRYEADTEFTFTEAGDTYVTVIAKEGDAVTDSLSITVTVTESHLEMPNAFSPNDDTINDVYQAKSSTKSIVEFHAYIFNRHGQKLYDWTNWSDPQAGWDGTYNGHPVKDGVYFVYVKARGADGVEYNIRRDVNLIRNYNQTTNSNQ